jgi:hypothetical protein
MEQSRQVIENTGYVPQSDKTIPISDTFGGWTRSERIMAKLLGRGSGASKSEDEKGAAWHLARDWVRFRTKPECVRKQTGCRNVVHPSSFRPIHH